MCENSEFCARLGLSMCGRVQLPSKQLLLMRPKLSKMIALAVVDFDMMQAIGMNNGKIVTSTMWV